MSFSWENVLSTVAVCIGMTLQICASVLIFGYKALVVGLVQRSCMTSLCFIGLKESERNCLKPLHSSKHSCGEAQVPSPSQYYCFANVLICELPYAIKCSISVVLGVLDNTGSLEGLNTSNDSKTDLSSNLPLIFSTRRVRNGVRMLSLKYSLDILAGFLISMLFF